MSVSSILQVYYPLQQTGFHCCERRNLLKICSSSALESDISFCRAQGQWKQPYKYCLLMKIFSNKTVGLIPSTGSADKIANWVDETIRYRTSEFSGLSDPSIAKVSLIFHRPPQAMSPSGPEAKYDIWRKLNCQFWTSSPPGCRTIWPVFQDRVINPNPTVSESQRTSILLLEVNLGLGSSLRGEVDKLD